MTLKSRIRPYKRREKYGAQKTAGFDSKLEAAVHQMLKLREFKGEITNIKRQQQVKLTMARIGYRVDFTCEQNGETVYIEAKGFPTREWALKRRLWEHYGPGTLEIWGGSYKSLKMTEIIRPGTNVCTACGKIMEA